MASRRGAREAAQQQEAAQQRDNSDPTQLTQIVLAMQPLFQQGNAQQQPPAPFSLTPCGHVLNRNFEKRLWSLLASHQAIWPDVWWNAAQPSVVCGQGEAAIRAPAMLRHLQGNGWRSHPEAIWPIHFNHDNRHEDRGNRKMGHGHVVQTSKLHHGYSPDGLPI